MQGGAVAFYRNGSSIFKGKKCIVLSNFPLSEEIVVKMLNLISPKSKGAALIDITSGLLRRMVRLCLHGLVCLLMLLTVFSAETLAGGAQDRSFEVFSKIPGVTIEDLEVGKKMIANLDYFHTRVFRALCKLPNVTASDVLRFLPDLSSEPITFYHLELFEWFSSLEGVTWEIAIKGLQEMRELEFSSALVANSLKNVLATSPDQFLASIQGITQLSDPCRWAAKSFFEISGQTIEKASQGMTLIMNLSGEECWAAESNSEIVGISVDEALNNIMAIGLVPIADAKNVRALFSLPEMTGLEAHYWLENYFVKPQDKKNALYQSLSNPQKSTLLKVFFQGSDLIIREINNLHSITDINEREVPAAALMAYSFEELRVMLDRLEPYVDAARLAEFDRFALKSDKDSAVDILRQATARARIMTARQCSAANLYILLSRVTVLFDSSFRNILLPELQKHIGKSYGGSLLAFLQAMDPENTFVSRFISSLAQKSKLVAFFPMEAGEQEAILELVAGSAFRDENSLIFFTASFVELLNIVKPEVRHVLLDKMLSLARDENAIFAQQIKVILQYYMEEQPELLGNNIVKQVQNILNKYGTVALSVYWGTPFAEWREDGVLSAISVFNSDDDGRSSFLANCRYLLSKGYLPKLTRSFFKYEQNPDRDVQLGLLIDAVGEQKPKSLENLFSFLAYNPVAVDFVKTVNMLEISHSMCIYQNNDTQKKLLEEFINGDHEMFIHRGHSYWLDDHLLIPLREIVQSELVNRERMAAKQRFLSIGSCGAINNYSELTRIFCNNIDMLGSLGAGKVGVNNLYNLFLFETVAEGPVGISWKEVDRRSSFIFQGDGGSSYLSPGSLPAILYKVIGEGRCWYR